jgi:hypothetical protein
MANETHENQVDEALVVYDEDAGVVSFHSFRAVDSDTPPGMQPNERATEHLEVAIGEPSIGVHEYEWISKHHGRHCNQRQRAHAAPQGGRTHGVARAIESIVLILRCYRQCRRV